MNVVRRHKSTIAILTGLIALQGCGGSGGGNSQPAPPAPDTTVPTVGAVSTTGEASLNRIVTISVTASDNVGVTEVRFKVDGVVIGTDNSAPYSTDWDTAAGADGDYVLSAEAEDAAGNVGQSADLTVSVQNTVTFDVALSGGQEVPPVDSAGSGQASITVNLASGDVSGSLTVTGINATAAHIHDAFAGDSGGVVIPLEQDAGDPALFAVSAGAALDTTGVDRLLAGALYVNAHTAAAPAGEVRGQILPEGFELYFTNLDSAASVPSVTSNAKGRAGITYDPATGALVVHAQTDGLDDATAAHVHGGFAGSNGAVLVPLMQDGMDAGHWFVEDGVLNGNGADDLAAGALYINVHSPEYPGGEIRGQILPDSIVVIRVVLDGSMEVPAVASDATGLAFLTLDEAGSTLSIHVNTENFPDASNAHLHSAYGGDNGPVEIGLTQDGTEPAHWFADAETLSAGQLAALLAGATYVNVHSPANPGGEIRGQVIPAGILFASGFLVGEQENPPVASAAGGTFAVTVDPDSMTVTAHASTSGADDATASHLHDGYAGTNGPVLVGLAQDGANVAHWFVEDAGLDAAGLSAVQSGRVYLNVHTPANPGGEIRGQVAPDTVDVVFTTVSGAQEVPAVTTAAEGVAATTIDRATGLITVHLRAAGADDATAAHVHENHAGLNGGVIVPLEQDAGDVTHWQAVEAGLDDAALAAYAAGRLYVNLHTPANPGGEIRGQITPPGVQVVFADLSPDQVVPPAVNAANGIVATTTDLTSRDFFAAVNTSGADDATSSGISIGAEGVNGAEILPLVQTDMLPSQWSAMTTLDQGQFSAYRAGRLYAQVATPGDPDGAIRGQIVPPDAADFDDTPPNVSLTSPGATVSGTVQLQAGATDNQGVVIVRFLADGTVLGTDASAPYSIDWDTTGVANGDVSLTAEAEDAAGNVGTSTDVVVTVDNAEPVSFAALQATVFGPNCSVCHTGPTGNTLPAGMNLSSAAQSYAALVNVPSIQQSALDRVEPNNPDDSYLIRKLEGAPGITGSRMPQGGPFLDQAVIDEIRQWIADGAPNN